MITEICRGGFFFLQLHHWFQLDFEAPPGYKERLREQQEAYQDKKTNALSNQVCSIFSVKTVLFLVIFVPHPYL